MKNFILNNLKELNLEFTPHTRAILDIYTNGSDEELHITNRYRKGELIRLYLASNLVELIITEYKNSSDYDGRTEVYLEDVNLNYTPHTKHLLKQFLIKQYEGTIETTNQNLKELLLDLHKNDRLEKDHIEKDNLGSLFVQEWISSPDIMEMSMDLSSKNINKSKGNNSLELVAKLQLVTDFDKLRDYSSRLLSENFLKARKNFKFLSLNEEKKDIILSNEPLTSVYVPLEKNLKETYREIEDIIYRLEEDVTISLKDFLKKRGLSLPANCRITLDEA